MALDTFFKKLLTKRDWTGLLLRFLIQPVIQCLLLAGFLVLAIQLSFVIPRYDYWDVVFQSTFIFQNGVVDPGQLISFLLIPSPASVIL